MLVRVPLAKPLRQPHPAITLCATQWRTGVRHRRRRSLSPGRSAPAPVMRAQPRGHSLKTNTFSAARQRPPHNRQHRCGDRLALLFPVLPFALEMLALRCMTPTAFGTPVCSNAMRALVFATHGKFSLAVSAAST